MFISALDGGLRGDFIAIYWIFEYLNHSIHVWNKNNARIMVKIEQENESTPLNLVYGNNHFKPIDIYSIIIDIPIHTQNDDEKKLKQSKHKIDIDNRTKCFDIFFEKIVGI